MEHKMTFNEKIIDITTGEETIRPLTTAETKVIKDNQLNWQNERDIEKASKNAAKQAVLDKLGLTADEAAILLG
jgi:gamma-glutamyl phosphate reductase